MATKAAGPSSDETTYALFLHLTGLSIFFGIPGILGPLIMWLIKKEDSEFIDRHGKDAVNFQLSVIIYAIAAVILIFTIVGIVIAIPVFIVIAVLSVLFPILAAIKAANGEDWTYPLSIRFLQ